MEMIVEWREEIQDCGECTKYFSGYNESILVILCDGFCRILIFILLIKPQTCWATKIVSVLFNIWTDIWTNLMILSVIHWVFSTFTDINRVCNSWQLAATVVHQQNHWKSILPINNNKNVFLVRKSLFTPLTHKWWNELAVKKKHRQFLSIYTVYTLYIVII